MQTENKQAWLVRDQPNEGANLCPQCGEYPQLLTDGDNHMLRCPKCGDESKFPFRVLDEKSRFLLCTFWNIKTTRVKWSKVMKGLLNVTDGSFLVYDLRDYAYIESFDTLLDAMTFMERRFNEDMEQRTALFQCNHNSLEFIMISDELWDN